MNIYITWHVFDWGLIYFYLNKSGTEKMKTFFKIILFVPVLIAICIMIIMGLFAMWYDTKFQPKELDDAVQQKTK